MSGLIDSTGRVVANLEITEMATMGSAEVSWEHVLADGREASQRGLVVVGREIVVTSVPMG